MWIIKNRVTGEYENKGIGRKRDRIHRYAWATLMQAKCHVAYVGFDEWFMDADFIEINEDGIDNIMPVSEYLREYYGAKKYTKDYIKERLGLS